MSIRSRLRKLEQAVGRRYSPDECPRNEVGAIVRRGEPVPENAPRCRGCGEIHVLEIVEEIIQSPGKLKLEESGT